jgi:hypothetical protein
VNRYDRIKCKARDIASHVHADPEARDTMADQLIELVGLMIDAVGKAVAIEGESAMNEADGYVEPGMSPEDAADAEREQREDATKAHNRYLIGEAMQNAASEVAGEARAVDVERYHRITPGSPCRCGHVRSVHESGEPCVGEQFNGEPCKDGPDHEFQAYGGEPVWQHVDRRPLMFRHMDERGALYLPPELADAQREYDAKVSAAAVDRAREVQAQAEAELARRMADLHVSRRREALGMNNQVPPTFFECCRADGSDHLCGIVTGLCCYAKDEVCPDHG